MNPLTIAFLSAIRELYALGPASDGHGFEPRLSHATDWLEEHGNADLCRLLGSPHNENGGWWHWLLRRDVIRLVEKHPGDPYLFDVIPGAAEERQRILHGI